MEDGSRPEDVRRHPRPVDPGAARVRAAIDPERGVAQKLTQRAEHEERERRRAPCGGDEEAREGADQDDVHDRVQDAGHEPRPERPAGVQVGLHHEDPLEDDEGERDDRGVRQRADAAVAAGAHDQHHRQRRENRVGDEVEVVGDRRLCRVRGDVEGDVACDEERVAEGKDEPRQARLRPPAPDAPEDRGDGAAAEDLVDRVLGDDARWEEEVDPAQDELDAQDAGAQPEVTRNAHRLPSTVDLRPESGESPQPARQGGPPARSAPLPRARPARPRPG